MPNIIIREWSINYTVNENFDPSMPTLLAIHGAGQSSLTWKYQEDVLLAQSGFNTIIPDLPGHNKSTGNGCRTVAEYKDFIKDFVDALSLKKLILMGHSMGGAISMLFMFDYPEMVIASLLVGTGAKLKVAKETLLVVKNDYETFCHVAPNRSFSKSAHAELKMKFVEGLLKTQPSVCYQDLIACDVFDIIGEVHRITAPTLIIAATEDILTPVKYAEYLNKEIEGSKLHIISDAGHFMMQEKPEEFNRVSLEFLNSIS